MDDTICESASLKAATADYCSLEGADLTDANLAGASLTGANLSHARCAHTSFVGAILENAHITDATFVNSDFRAADLTGTDLVSADITGNRFYGANVHMARMTPAQAEYLKSFAVRELSMVEVFYNAERSIAQSRATYSIQIAEDPLAAYNLASIMSALVHLHTKAWLLNRRDFDDLALYAQTHERRFAEAAGLAIIEISHSSSFEFKFDMSLSSAGDAIRTIVETLTTVDLKRNELRLKNEQLEATTSIQTQQAAIEAAARETELRLADERAALERERELLSLERERLKLEEERFRLRMARLELAAKAAAQFVDIVQPTLEFGERQLAIQLVITDVLELEQSHGLQLAR